MAIGSVLSVGLQGVQAGISRVDQAGATIARVGASAESGDLATPIVDLKVGELQVKASTMAIKIGDQILGTLIDIKA
jgi:hypothetical protein